jgi:hypothetical protein
LLQAVALQRRQLRRFAGGQAVLHIPLGSSSSICDRSKG